LVESRVREAAKFTPIERLGICPQCGFRTFYEGNPITEEAQRVKIKVITSVAKKI
jgi:5-methyltetrahydropteroyltriglutamate--homocysteine methyltransferase